MLFGATLIAGPSRVNQKIPESNKIQISTDYNGVCCGFMTVPVRYRKIIEIWRDLGPMVDYVEFDGRDTWEQNVLKLLMKHFPKFKDSFELLGEEVVANPKTQGLENLPSMFHMWAHGSSSNMREWSEVGGGIILDRLYDKGIVSRRTQ